MSFTLEFTPWRPFLARMKLGSIHGLQQAVATASKAAFVDGMGNYPPSSAPGAWPNNRTGNLRASIQTEIGALEMTIGTNMRYSKYLREGTRPMKGRRKMSDNALEEGMKNVGGRLGRWVEWTHT